MAGAPAGSATPGPIALDFGPPRETLFQQLVRHWLNERHAPDILPAQTEILGSLLDHIRRQVRRFCFLPVWVAVREQILRRRLSLDGYRSSAPWGSRLVRGRTRADHARADRGRARQVCRALLYPHAVVQGTYIPFHRSATFELLTDNSQIEKYARYIVSTPEVQEKLSQAELDHAKRCARDRLPLACAVGLT